MPQQLLLQIDYSEYSSQLQQTLLTDKIDAGPLYMAFIAKSDELSMTIPYLQFVMIRTTDLVGYPLAREGVYA